MAGYNGGCRDLGETEKIVHRHERAFFRNRGVRRANLGTDIDCGDRSAQAARAMTKAKLPGRQGETVFRPGQSGNPAGRPKGSRNKLGEDLIAALHADFAVHGESVIAKVRDERPEQYLKVIASIIPKELHVKDLTLEDMSDD